MSRISVAVTVALCLASAGAHAFSLGEAEDKQGQLARAKMDADIADADAKARLSSATGQPADTEKTQRPSNPARDFSPYGFYEFGPRTCADVVFRDVLYTRCIGDTEGIDGWKLVSLTQQKAVFSKGHEQCAVVMGVAMGSTGPDGLPGGSASPTGHN